MHSTHRWFSGNRFPTPWTANMYFIPGSIVIGQSNEFSAHAFRSPANQLQVVLLIHALVDRSQSNSTHNCILAWLERLFPLPPSAFISHFQGLPVPLLGIALYIGAYVLSASFYLLTSYRHYVYFYTKKNYLVIPLICCLINGFGDKCCWQQPFSPTLKRCLGYLSLGEKQWSHPLPLAIIPPGAWHRHMPPCPCARDTHLTVLYATHWY